MDLNEITIFANVVQAGSFTAAAHKLAIPKSTVSRKVSELEARLGAQLLQRTTRQLHLTDAGRTYAQYAARIVAEVEEASLAVSRMQETPRGLVRVSAPLSVGFLGPAVRSFLQRYPETQLEMVCTDRVVDLVNEGFDLAVRAGKLVDSTLIARPLGALPNYVVASPGFVAKHGTAKKPKDLAKLPCLVFGAGAQRGNWTLVNDDEATTVTVPTRLTTNDFDVLLDAAVAGTGIALLPLHLTIGPLRKKQLVRLLAPWSAAPIPLHAVYPGTRLLSPKVKAFVEHLKEQLTPPPWELGPKI
jgi:DNA-binding transcriptional LysR family regulator